MEHYKVIGGTPVLVVGAKWKNLSYSIHSNITNTVCSFFYDEDSKMIVPQGWFYNPIDIPANEIMFTLNTLDAISLTKNIYFMLFNGATNVTKYIMSTNGKNFYDERILPTGSYLISGIGLRI